MPFRSRVIVIFLTGLVLCAPACFCEWQNFGAAHGLEFVRGMAIDSVGGYWFAAAGGLVKYDGNRWRTHGHESCPAAPDATVLLVDRAGNLWFAAQMADEPLGVWRFDGVGCTNYTTADGLADNRVHAILEDRLGRMWFGTDAGASCYDGATWKTYTSADGLASDCVTCVTEDREGNLWFAGIADVSRFDGTSWQTYTIDNCSGGRCITSMLVDRAGRLWLGMFERTDGVGAVCYDGVDWRSFTTGDGLTSDWVLSILEDKTGCLWFGTRNGVSRYDGAGWTTLTAADGLSNDFVLQILEDRAGNLWFDTGAGVSRYDKVDWRSQATISPPVGLRHKVMLQDSKGGLWSCVSGGVACYDGFGWRKFTVADGLADSVVSAIAESPTGVFWFGTGNGVSRFDGTQWQTYTVEDGLARDSVIVGSTDSTGRLWFGTLSGLSCFDGTNWRTYTVNDGLASNVVRHIAEDRTGSIWVASDSVPSRFDGVDWQALPIADGFDCDRIQGMVADGLGNVWVSVFSHEEQNGLSRFDGTTWARYFPTFYVSSMLVDRLGYIWVGGDGGVVLFDGINWHGYLAKLHGEGDVVVVSMHQDRAGNMWFGMSYGYGAARFDGSTWTYYDDAEGLTCYEVGTIAEDCRGVMWFGYSDLGEDSITLFEPDHVSPLTLFLQTPDNLCPTRQAAFSFLPAFGEGGVEFSCALDAGPWSAWSLTNSYVSGELPDGAHTFEVRARDRAGNVERAPAAWSFEVDATPPSPVIASPFYGQAVRDSIVIRGTASDTRLRTYRVEALPPESSAWVTLSEDSTEVDDGVLCGWNTTSFADGDYDLRLSVTDTLGLVGTALVRVTVDNHAPWAYETTPALVRTTVGGDVFTTDGMAHLYFPPHAFQQDATVIMAMLSDSLVPEWLSDGAQRVFAGYEIGWGDIELLKQGTLEFSYRAAGLELSIADAAFYCAGADSVWRRLGGTVDGVSGKISAPLSAAGRYALFSGETRGPGTRSLAILSLVPRVFSPSGSFARDRLAVSFELGQPASVNVRIYNRAGRLVRDVLSGQVMNAGANLVYWDGRDGGGAVVPEGVYLVSVEIDGHRDAKTVSVVR